MNPRHSHHRQRRPQEYRHPVQNDIVHEGEPYPQRAPPLHPYLPPPYLRHLLRTIHPFSYPLDLVLIIAHEAGG